MESSSKAKSKSLAIKLTPKALDLHTKLGQIPGLEDHKDELARILSQIPSDDDEDGAEIEYAPENEDDCFGILPPLS